jgi:translation initiation factor 4A|uniref:Helicase n=1 Tax=viral metagenome TaxID=1070528 RepID=A0A6C0IM59_9ZZZZ
MENIDIKVWSDLNLKDDLLRGIYAYGFEEPSEIQKKAIHPILKKRDIITQAQSGSGKTGTFSISTLQLVDPLIDCTQAIILAPTHELAFQIDKVISSISTFIDGLQIKSLVGGTSVQEDIKYLQNNRPHIIVGTIGRTLDMIKKRLLHLDQLRIFVLDEADELLSGTFKENIQNIVQKLSTDTQIAIFSATMPPPIIELTEKFMNNPYKIIVDKEELTLECIEQSFIAVEDDAHKYNTLKQIFETLSINQCIVFVNGVNRVTDLYEAMKNENYNICCMHSNMSKQERKDTITSFRSGGYRLLLSSDVTARGIDVQQVELVINFDIPNNVNTYLHRIGRGGRWGRKGVAINLITRKDVNQMRYIETHYNISIKEFKKTSVFV